MTSQNTTGSNAGQVTKWVVIGVIALLAFLLLWFKGGSFGWGRAFIDIPGEVKERTEDLNREIDGNEALLEILDQYKQRHGRDMSDDEIEAVTQIESSLRERNLKAAGLLRELEGFSELPSSEQEELLSNVAGFLADDSAGQTFMDWGIRRNADQLAWLRRELAARSAQLATANSELEEARIAAVRSGRIADVWKKRLDSASVAGADSAALLAELRLQRHLDSVRVEAERKQAAIDRIERDIRGQIRLESVEFVPSADRQKIKNGVHRLSTITKEGIRISFTPVVTSMDKRKERKLTIVFHYPLMDNKGMKQDTTVRTVEDGKTITVPKNERWFGRGQYVCDIWYEGVRLERQTMDVD